ncbi:MAG TPA: tripartite tricarboxylate transporter substrate binding protein [Xanthobacteraceae bacterium]|nr:tripartite tricarboxylate transporter substrate binding protein [Xanthobacteraceae bacterium]
MWRCGLSALAIALVAVSGSATAQTFTTGLAPAAQTPTAPPWPSKPIRVIVPFSPGSGTDIVARIVTEQLSTQFGQIIIIENRIGAGGTIGVGAVAKAEADGYTLLIHSTTHVVAASTYSNPGYDTVRDFAGITPLVSLPNVLVVAANKYKTVKQLVDAAKAARGSMNYASVGAGSAAHLNGERFRQAAGIELQHIPYKGGPEGLTAIIKGDVDFFFIPLPAARGLIAAGNVAAIAVSGSKRASALPDVPTTVEAGFPNSDYNFWVGMFAPVGTPKAIVERLHAETTKALKEPAVVEKLAKIGGDPQPMQPADFDSFVRKEIEVNAALVKAARLQVN